MAESAGATLGGAAPSGDGGQAGTQGNNPPPDGGQGGAPTPSGDGGQVVAWNANFDEVQTQFVSNKGWQSADDMLRSYRDLEGLVGADTFKIPKQGDQEAFKALYSKLGCPEDPKEYQFEGYQNTSTETIDWFRDVAHSAGLSQQQAQAIATEFDKFNNTITQASNDAFLEQMNQEGEQLKLDWGEQYDMGINLAQKAVKALGFTAEELDGMERVLGRKSLFTRMRDIGLKVGEDPGVGGQGGARFNYTPEQAQQRIQELQKDTLFFKKIQDGDVEAKAEWDRLHKQAFPDG